MQPWERRLRDLSQLLKNCESTYFDPDLFRQNTNQFLQTSRTVTFIVQKNKASIPNFDAWYKPNVIDAWGNDKIMTWAKNARNVIEKEGDLDMGSELRTSLLFSHESSEDMVLSTDRTELLKANLDKLVRRARASLPPGIADGAVLKIERRWVANSLADHELGQALIYIYGRMHKICETLSGHLGYKLDTSIPHPIALGSIAQDPGATRYMRLNKQGVGRSKSFFVSRDKDYAAPSEILELAKEVKSSPKPTSLKEVHDLHTKMARITFEVNGNHVPMLFLYDDHWKQIDFISTAFTHQSDKFIFWRTIAERAASLRASALIWTSEVWIRDMKDPLNLPIGQMPIVGEKLQVIGLDVSDGYEMTSFDITRASPTSKPALGLAIEKEGFADAKQIFFAAPVLAAMRAVRS